MPFCFFPLVWVLSSPSFHSAFSFSGIPWSTCLLCSHSVSVFLLGSCPELFNSCSIFLFVFTPSPFFSLIHPLFCTRLLSCQTLFSLYLSLPSIAITTAYSENLWYSHSAFSFMWAKFTVASRFLLTCPCCLSKICTLFSPLRNDDIHSYFGDYISKLPKESSDQD